MLTRGSKTAAEKVVRESESGPDMGSPDRRESIPPVTDMQDSPLFKFLSELSPRRQGEEAGASQGTDVKMEASGDDVFMGEKPRGEGMGEMSSAQLDPECTSREMDGTGGSGGSFGTEFTDYSQLESRVSAAMASEIVRCSDGKNEKVGAARSELSDAGERRQSTSSLMSHVIDCVVPGNLSQESRCREGEEQRRLSMGCSSGIEGHGLTFSPVAKGSPELDRETTAIAYFLAGNLDVRHGNEESSEDSSEVVVPRVPLRGAPGYCGNDGDMKNESVPRQMLHAMTPQSGLGNRSEEGHDPGTVITSQDVGQQQGLLSNRGDSSGQRGFSRRCLDIDASVARRKSLGSMGGRKPVGSRLKDCSGSIAGDSSNADCVVGDVVPATPDGPSGRVQARASGLANSNNSSRAESDSGTHTRGASTCGDSLGGMTRMQFTSSPYRGVWILEREAGRSADSDVAACSGGGRRSDEESRDSYRGSPEFSDERRAVQAGVPAQRTRDERAGWRRFWDCSRWVRVGRRSRVVSGWAAQGLVRVWV